MATIWAEAAVSKVFRGVGHVVIQLLVEDSDLVNLLVPLGAVRKSLDGDVAFDVGRDAPRHLSLFIAIVVSHDDERPGAEVPPVATQLGTMYQPPDSCAI